MVPTRVNDDPLSLALQPPKDETPTEREKRIQAEEYAVKISEEIDKELNKERAERRKRRPEIKVLLLGPSCSGKSTTLKNFQLAFTPKALQAEAATYAALVFLNVVSSVRLLCDVLEEARTDPDSPPLPTELEPHAARLKAVVDLEATLTRRFGDSLSVQPRGDAAAGQGQTYELSVRTGGLRKMLQSSRKAKGPGAIDAEAEEVRTILVDHKGDIEALIRSPVVREMMAVRSLHLEHLPGYFLDDLARITAPNYAPTDDDILRTRIRTLGVSEMHFTVESGRDKGQTWVVVDVGGARHQRAAWVPYFDDASAVIFMAPIGQFDQFLDEDPTMNCIRDSLELWENIVSQKLLENAEMILFLNKHDMMKEKLSAGIEFSQYITSYSDRNDAESVGKYLQRKFAAIHKQRSPKARTLHCHFTSVTDKSSTVALITHFRVAVLQNHLRETTLL